MGVFHAKGWWSKGSCPPSKVCLPWVSKTGIWDVPGILLGCPGRLGVFKNFVPKKVRAHFAFPKLGLVALYRAMRLRRGYGFESCDANGPRNVKNTNIAKHRPIFLLPLLLVGSKELVLKVPKRGQFHAAIRVTRKRCDSCAQVAQGARTVSRRNF